MRNLVQLSEIEGFKIEEVKQFEDRDRDRPDFDHRYLKILYFFIKEGIISTLRKYYAHKQEQIRYLTFLKVLHAGNIYLNISVQSQTNSSDFVISNEFYPFVEIEYEGIQEKLELYLERFNQFADQAGYELFKIKTDTPFSFNLKSQTYKEQFDQGLFIYGLGGYVNMFIMHHFKKFKKIACVDYKAKVSRAFQEKFGFRHSFLVPRDSYQILQQTKRPIVIIAAYHSDHATLAEEIHNTNPDTQIFIEKPPTVTLEDLGKLTNLYRKGAALHMGFNRRFIPWSKDVRDLVKGQIMVVTCSVKEVLISSNHWYFWENQGTRVTGNVVHWFDLANYWIESKPEEINVIASPDNLESSAISVLYRNGSVLNITASDRGNSLRGVQEKIEVRFGNETIFIDDFTSFVHLKSNGVMRKRRRLHRDKGHSRMYGDFSRIVNGQMRPEYPVTDLINTSVVTYYASKILREGTRSVNIGEVIDKYHSAMINQDTIAE